MGFCKQYVCFLFLLGKVFGILKDFAIFAVFEVYLKTAVFNR